MALTHAALDQCLRRVLQALVWMALGKPARQFGLQRVRAGQRGLAAGVAVAIRADVVADRMARVAMAGAAHGSAALDTA
ncbi:MAG TPA: hypothetical protein VHK65_04495 [Candidatus Dormibacteraeota bacterium]|nr:hypothetical protein [Candidatus Dormibacteraeota bacterium]